MPEMLSDKTDIVFIDYIDIIRSPWVKVLNYIKEHAGVFDPFFNIEYIPKTEKEIKAWSLIREDYNGLLQFATDEFDYDELLLFIENQIPDLYSGEDFNEIGNFIDLIAAQKSTKTIYVYTPEFDSRIAYDLDNHFSSNDIVYVCGDFYDTIEECKPNFFILNNVEELNSLIRDHLDVVRGTDVLLSKHLYNFRIIDEKGVQLVPDVDEEFEPDVLEKNFIRLNLFSSMLSDLTLLEDESIMRIPKKDTFYDAFDMRDFIDKYGEDAVESPWLMRPKHIIHVDKLNETGEIVDRNKNIPILKVGSDKDEFLEIEEDDTPDDEKISTIEIFKKIAELGKKMKPIEQILTDDDDEDYEEDEEEYDEEVDEEEDVND